MRCWFWGTATPRETQVIDFLLFSKVQNNILFMLRKYIPLYFHLWTKTKERRMGISRELRGKLGKITPRRCLRKIETSESLLQMQLLVAPIYVEYEMWESKIHICSCFSFLNQGEVRCISTAPFSNRKERLSSRDQKWLQVCPTLKPTWFCQLYF